MTNKTNHMVYMTEDVRAAFERMVEFAQERLGMDYVGNTIFMLGLQKVAEEWEAKFGETFQFPDVRPRLKRMDIDYEKLGKIVVQKRKRRNLSQEALAALLNNRYGLNINNPIISHLENGTRVPKAEVVNAVIDFFGLQTGKDY